MQNTFLKKMSVDKYTNYSVTIIINGSHTTNISVIEDAHYGEILVNNLQCHTFNYFNGSFNEITFRTVTSQNNFDIQLQKINTTINQIYVNNVLKIAFLEENRKAYNLKEYNDDYSPSIFYGIYREEDVRAIEKNKSLKLVIFCGGDVNHDVPLIGNTNLRSAIIIEKIKRIAAIPKVRFISISSFISQSLQKISIPYKQIPYMGVDLNLYKASSKGNCIYLYTSPPESFVYGEELYIKLMEKYSNIKFIVTCCKYYYDQYVNFNKEMKHDMKCYDKNTLINEIYPKCFIGLRLTKHDGLAGTVQELGLLGIKSIHNGTSPSSLNYKNFDDICKHIDNEMKTIGTTDNELAQKVKTYLTMDPAFFTTNFHSSN